MPPDAASTVEEILAEVDRLTKEIDTARENLQDLLDQRGDLLLRTRDAPEGVRPSLRALARRLGLTSPTIVEALARATERREEQTTDVGKRRRS